MVNDPGNKLSLLKVRREAMPAGLTVEAERRNNLLDLNTTTPDKEKVHELVTALGKEILPPRVYFTRQDSMGDSLINVKFVDIRKHDTAPEQKKQEQEEQQYTSKEDTNPNPYESKIKPTTLDSSFDDEGLMFTPVRDGDIPKSINRLTDKMDAIVANQITSDDEDMGRSYKDFKKTGRNA